MLSARARIATVILITLSLASIAAAQQPASSAPTPSARSAEYVEASGFKGKVFDVKHRDPSALTRAVHNLGSGFKGATISYNDEFKTITVRDFPENIVAIEDALKRLDTPIPPRPNIEFHIHVLIASSVVGAADEYPAELRDVIKQLQATLKYKNYSLMTSSIHRTREGPAGITNNGVAESKLFSVNTPQGNPIFYNYGLDQVSVEGGSSDVATVRVNMLSFNMRIPISIGPGVQYENVGFRAPVSLREGEKVVVGTTTIADKGLVVVLMAKVIK